jgi:hypothetical protein
MGSTIQVGEASGAVGSRSGFECILFFAEETMIGEALMKIGMDGALGSKIGIGN